MSLQLLTEGSWDAVETALLDYLKEAPTDHLLTERWVLVPHLGLARYLQHRAAGLESGSSGIRFLRFNDLAGRLLRTYGRVPAPEMGEVVRDLLLRQVLREQLPRLERTLNLASVGTAAFTEAVRKTLNDLREAGIERGALQALAGGTSGRSSDRLEALVELYGAWVELLDRTDAYDPEGLVRAAATVVSDMSPGSLPGLTVYGFYDLTGGQWELLRSLIDSTDVRMYAPVYPETEAYAGALLTDWRDRAEEVEIVDHPGAPSCSPVPVDDLWTLLADGDSGSAETVTIISAPGRGREVDTALRITAAAWYSGNRTGDTRLLAADPDGYRKQLSQQARSNGFMADGDRGAPRAELNGWQNAAGEACPAGIVTLLLTMLNALTDDLSADAITRLLQSAGCAGNEKPIPLLGGSLLKEVASGGDLDHWIEMVGEAVERVEMGFGGKGSGEGGEGEEEESRTLKEQVRRDRRQARARSFHLVHERLGSLRELLHELPLMASWLDWVEALRSLALSLVSPPWYGEIDDALERLRGLIVLDGEVGIPEVIETVREVEHAISGSGPIPIHNLMELRGTRKRLSVVLGLAEGSWPRRPTQDPLLPDHERKALTGSEEWLLPTARRRIDEERLLFRLLLETGSHVVLLYPRLDETGRERRASPHILDLMRLIMKEDLSQDQLESLAAGGTRRLGDTRPMAGGPLMGELDRDMAAVGEALDGGDRDALRALWSSPTFREGWRAELSRWRGEAGPWSGFLTTGQTSELACGLLGLEEESTVSVSLLESYAACPWKVFTGRVLGLPEEATETDGLLDSVEMGTVLHDVLHEYVKVSSREGWWPPAAEAIEAQRADITRLAGKHVRRAHRRRGLPAPLFEEIDQRRALKRMLGWLRWEAGSGGSEGKDEIDLGTGAVAGWDMREVEKSFEVPVKMAGRRLRLIGRWDRVDRDRYGRIRILDYKTGNGKPGESGDLGGGLNLQMYLYQVAAAGTVEDEDCLAGGVFLHLRPDRPEGPPVPVIWPIESVTGGRRDLDRLVVSLLDSMGQGVFMRLPHDERRDSRTGLCAWCPTPTICRGWREEESLRHYSDELLAPLNMVRSMEQSAEGGA